MFQPEVKYEFVRRYCSPSDGWQVHIDIDPSEEGRTGGMRKSDEAKQRQKRMQRDGIRVRRQCDELGIVVGGSRQEWFSHVGVPSTSGDRDAVACHGGKRLCVVAEVEGQSTGQPEQKLYKAMGQLIMARSNLPIGDGWTRLFVLVVYGSKIAAHARRATALAELGICGLEIAALQKDDAWLLGDRGKVFRGVQ